MKRRDLKPGTYFWYVVNPHNTYWVRAPGEERCSVGVLFSGPNPDSGDWDLDVEVIGEDEARKRGDAYLAEHAPPAPALDPGVTTDDGDDPWWTDDGGGGGDVDFDEDPVS